MYFDVAWGQTDNLRVVLFCLDFIPSRFSFLFFSPFHFRVLGLCLFIYHLRAKRKEWDLFVCCSSLLTEDLSSLLTEDLSTPYPVSAYFCSSSLFSAYLCTFFFSSNLRSSFLSSSYLCTSYLCWSYLILSSLHFFFTCCYHVQKKCRVTYIGETGDRIQKHLYDVPLACF